MKNVILGLLCCLVATGAAGQKKKGTTVAQEPVSVEYYKDGEAVYMEVGGGRLYLLTEEMPVFPMEDVHRWVARRVRYPVMAMERGISGTVYVQFVVEKDGKVTGVKAREDADALLRQEAERVFMQSPAWTPGKHNGEAVRVQMTEPINFRLSSGFDLPPGRSAYEGMVYAVTEVEPRFPEGNVEEWIRRRVREAYEGFPKKWSGETGRVFVSFVIEKNGVLSDVVAIHGTNEFLKRAAVRIIKSMPKWEPGKNKGVPVRHSMTLQVDFQVPDAVTPENGEERMAEAKEEKRRDSTMIFADGHKMPVFSGGNVQKWVDQRVRELYRQGKLKEGDGEGKVFVQFVIEADGAVTDVKAVRSVNKVLDEEAVRIVKSMPKWEPGFLNGEAVRTAYTLPIYFRASEQMIELEDGQTIPLYYDQMPSFPAGNVQKWIRPRVQELYRQGKLKESDGEGKVFVHFIIDRDGSVINAQVARGVNEVLDREAVRIIESMPKWNPGIHRGRAEQVMITLPVVMEP